MTLLLLNGSDVHIEKIVFGLGLLLGGILALLDLGVGEPDAARARADGERGGLLLELGLAGLEVLDAHDLGVVKLAGGDLGGDVAGGLGALLLGRDEVPLPVGGAGLLPLLAVVALGRDELAAVVGAAAALAALVQEPLRALRRQRELDADLFLRGGK